MDKKVSQFIIDAYNLKDEFSSEVELINPLELICSERLDIVAKLLYLEKKEKDLECAEDFYLEHIRVMTKCSFVEAGSEKQGKSAFVEAFGNLLNAMRENGYCDSSLPIPVDMNNKILDGAHRVAAAIYLGISVPIVRLPVIGEYDIYDYKYFQSYDMNLEYLDEVLLRYVELKENVYCFNVWPSAVGNQNSIENIFEKNGCRIVYFKEVSLNETGAFNYLSQIYSEFSWAQNDHDGFGGIYRKLVPCFKTFDPVRVFFVEADNNDVVLQCKEEIRKLFNIEKHSVHATDNYQETLLMGRLLLSQNSLDFMNSASPLSEKSNLKFLEQFKRYNTENVLFDSSIVMALYGIRAAEDLDFLTTDVTLKDNHNDYLCFYKKSLNELMYNPKLYFWYFNHKFVVLDEVMNFKQRRNSSKDNDDLKLYQIYKNKKAANSNKKFDITSWVLKKKRRIIASLQGNIIKLSHKTGTYNLLRKIYKLVKRA